MIRIEQIVRLTLNRSRKVSSLSGRLLALYVSMLLVVLCRGVLTKHSMLRRPVS